MKPISTFYSLLIIFFLTLTNTSSFAKKAAIIMDYDTKEILYQINADTRNYPASLTKMMTIYIVFDYLKKKRLTWETKMLVSDTAASKSPSKLNLKIGTYISVDNAIRALIIKSANDVAAVVAEHISGTESKFAKLMTKYGKKIGMKKTTFKNASGLPNKYQLTTARDMAILSHALISNFPNKYKLFSEKTFKWKNKTYKTHNHLMLKYEGADGIKTGYIRKSGFQLAFSAVKENKRLIGVYFGGDTGKQRDTRLALYMNNEFKKLNVLAIEKKDKIKVNKSSNSYKIVVGTFKYKKNAVKQINVIQKNYPITTSNKDAKVVTLKSGKRTLYESRFRFFSKKEAKIACSRLKKYNRDCFIRN
jgi:D-alanyl-D-alanine carboxypeptidase